MNLNEFEERFPAGTQIGVFPSDEFVKYFHDNGTDIGVWIYNRGDTTGRGEILDPENSHIARHFYRQRQNQGRER